MGVVIGAGGAAAGVGGREPVAVVTGGTRGIGAAITTRLVADGHECVFTGTSAQRPPGASRDGDYIGVNLADRAATARFAAHLSALRPDVLVNNAGVNLKGPTVAFPEGDYDTVLDVNLRAPMMLMQAVLPAMTARGWGRIVNVTSIWGVTANPRDAAYCASKFGLDGLTASIAAEVAGSGVLMNCVAPGYIETDLLARHSQEDVAAAAERIPAGRIGLPREVAALVSWLVGAENTYVTGQNILIDGGLTRTART